MTHFRLSIVIGIVFILVLSNCQKTNQTQQLAFVSNQSGNDEIYLSTLDGRNIFQLTKNLADDRFPSWSPNDSQIAFVSTRNYLENGEFGLGKTDIFIMNIDGTYIFQLTNIPSNNTTPTWSPDGKKIVFVSNRDRGLPNIYLINIDGSGLKQLTENTIDINPVWSPDGQFILFSSHRGVYTEGNTNCLDIYLMKPDGTGIKRLTNTIGMQISPAWSPDGTEIAFLSDPEGINQSFDLWKMKLDGTNLKRLTKEGLVFSHVTWSADGKKLLFDKETIPHSGKSTIFSINENGSNEESLIFQNSFWPVLDLK